MRSKAGAPAVGEPFRQRVLPTIAGRLRFDLSVGGRRSEPSGASIPEGAACLAAQVPMRAGIKVLDGAGSLRALKSAHDRVTVARRQYEESFSPAPDFDENPDYDFEDAWDERIARWVELETATAEYWRALKAEVAGPADQPRGRYKRPAPHPPGAAPPTQAARQLHQAREQLHEARQAFENVGRSGGSARTPANGFQQDLNEVRATWAAVKAAEEAHRGLTDTSRRHDK